jgi:Lon protease (S16) C-terminal proteolytic domain
MKSVHELCASEHLWPEEETQLAKALKSPWLAPRRCGKQQLQSPPSPPCGRTLLVSVNRASRTGSLWQLGRFDPPITAAQGARELVYQAAEALDLSIKIVMRDLPVAVELDALARRGRWQAIPLYFHGEPPVVLDGGSFGLSMLLAAASLVTGIPVPPDVAASAQILPDGGLQWVNGLKEKTEIVSRSALGVKRFFVHASQEAEAKKWRDYFGGQFEVEPVTHASRVFGKVFPNAAKAVEERWQKDKYAPSGIEDSLFRLALRGSTLVDYRCIKSAAKLAQALSDSDLLRAKARFAELVAKRHCGEVAPIPWPEPDVLRRMGPESVQWRYLAHVVQSRTDCAPDTLEEVIGRALQVLPERPAGHEEELALRGAIGRGYSSMRRYEDAQTMLEVVVATYLNAYRPELVSWAISELLRVMGIRNDVSSLRALLTDQVVTFDLDPRSDEISRGFVRLASGRALALCQQWSDARDALLRNDIGWGWMPGHLRCARLRWLTAAHQALGEGAAASVCRERLEQACTGDLAVQSKLVELDEALAGRADTALLPDLTETINAIRPHATARLLEGASDARERAVRVAREYPY